MTTDEALALLRMVIDSSMLQYTGDRELLIQALDVLEAEIPIYRAERAVSDADRKFMGAVNAMSENETEL